jgi:hypothetical protein
MYGNPVVTPMDIARNGGIMEDVYGSMEEYWEEQNDVAQSDAGTQSNVGQQAGRMGDDLLPF